MIGLGLGYLRMAEAEMWMVGECLESQGQRLLPAGGVLGMNVGQVMAGEQEVARARVGDLVAKTVMSYEVFHGGKSPGLLFLKAETLLP